MKMKRKMIFMAKMTRRVKVETKSMTTDYMRRGLMNDKTMNITAK